MNLQQSKVTIEIKPNLIGFKRELEINSMVDGNPKDIAMAIYDLLQNEPEIRTALLEISERIGIGPDINSALRSEYVGLVMENMIKKPQKSIEP